MYGIRPCSVRVLNCLVAFLQYTVIRSDPTTSKQNNTS